MTGEQQVDCEKRQPIKVRSAFRINDYPVFAMAHVVFMVQSRIVQEIDDPRINASAWRVLSILAEQAPITVKQLAQQAILERPALSRVADRFEAEGLLSRSPNPADSRSTLLSLTEEGNALYLRCSAIAARVMSETFSRLGTKKNRMLHDLVQQLYDTERSR